jgi:hypothetical protein
MSKLFIPCDGYELSVLQSNFFKLIFSKIPHVEFWAQKVRIPDLSMGYADHPTRIHDLKWAGEKLKMEPLITRILVDEALNVYSELYTWMYNVSVNGLASDSFSDCIVEIGEKKWHFNDVLPVSINSFEMDSAQAGSSPVTLDATFVYNNFTFQ